jgi:hypothetical protein
MRLRASLAMGSSLLALSALIAACGGGGGGGGNPATPPVSGSGGGSTLAPSTAPSGSSASISGSLVANGTAIAMGSTVTVTCGCSGEAGEATAGSGGSYSVAASMTPIPSSPAPYQLASGRNYLIIGYQPGSSLQAWTMEFLGNTPATNLNLSNTPSNNALNTSDVAATAAALYVYYESSQIQKGNVDQTFDLFNFNAIAAWAQHLRTGSDLSSAETKFVSDIQTAQSGSQSLFPGSALPSWDPNTSTYRLNTTMTSDINAIAQGGTAADPSLPTPCPGGAGTCTGTPTP